MSGVKALLGNELTPTKVKDQPSVSWNADPNSFYTLCLTGKYSIILTDRLQVFNINIIFFIVILTQSLMLRAVLSLHKGNGIFGW